MHFFLAPHFKIVVNKKNDASMHLLVCMRKESFKEKCGTSRAPRSGRVCLFVFFLLLTLFSSSPIIPFQDPFIVSTPKNPSGEGVI